jgi:hypothetical protein
MRVRVLDSLGRETSGGAPVDDDNGEFVLRFEPVFGDRPRALVVEQAGCAEETFPVTRTEWRSKQDVERTFTCRRAQ